MARPRSDVYKRFKDKVKIVDSGCHEWQSTIKRDGYGQFHHDGRAQRAHKVSYELFKGEVPSGVVIMHTCDNKKCVNPDHLKLGTTRDNIADMDAKKRRGTKSKLTNADVAEIKKMLADRHSQQSIADKFGVYQTTISRIKLGQTKLFKEK